MNKIDRIIAERAPALKRAGMGRARNFAPLHLERSGRENALKGTKADLAPRRKAAKGKTSSRRDPADPTGPSRGRRGLTGFCQFVPCFPRYR